MPTLNPKLLTHPPAEVLDAACLHELSELPEKVVAGDGLVVQLGVLKRVHGGEDGLSQLLPNGVVGGGRLSQSS